MYDKSKIKEAVKYVLNQPKPKKERQFSFWSYCKGVGGLKKYSADDMQLCSDLECANCRRFVEAFKEEIDRQINKDKI